MENTNFDCEIKLSNWDKKIKINEKGDYIILHIGDLNLIVDMGKFLENLCSEFEKVQDEIKKETDDKNRININAAFSRKICDSLNKFFKDDDLSNKIFSTNTPYVDDIIDFITQICDIIEKFTGQKIDNFSKISNKFKNSKNNRLGSRI